MTDFCCDGFKATRLNYRWMSMVFEGKIEYLMPHFQGLEVDWRVNYCPVCGVEVRAIRLSEEKFNEE